MIDLEKYSKAVSHFESQYGRFTLFALFLREDAPDRWDLLVSSRWLESGEIRSLGDFVDELKQQIGEEEFLILSRIVTLTHEDQGLWAILRAVRLRRGVAEIRDVSFFGVVVKHGYVLRADRSQLELTETE